jgi:hypothetical protein
MVARAGSLKMRPASELSALPVCSGPGLRVRYFAYGSNLDQARLADRCPGVAPLGPGRLPHATLQFRRYLTVAPHLSRSVPGAVFSLPLEEVPGLDQFEGFPDLYERFVVLLEDGSEAFTYIQKSGSRPIQPAPLWYFSLVCRAYDSLGLDESESGLLESAQEAARRACTLPSFLLHGKDLVFAASSEELWEALFDHRGPVLRGAEAPDYVAQVARILGISDPSEAMGWPFEKVRDHLAMRGVLIELPGRASARPAALFA